MTEWKEDMEKKLVGGRLNKKGGKVKDGQKAGDEEEEEKVDGKMTK